LASPQQVQKYQKGVNRIAASRLFDIARALDMPVARFFENVIGRASSPGLGGNVESALATSEGQQRVALFASIKGLLSAPLEFSVREQAD
jgi:hypothetical protein